MLGKLAVAQRNHAMLNDNACEKLRKPITVDDYLNSRMIADPDPAARQRDGVRRRERAHRDQPKNAKQKGLSKIVVPIGYGERTNYRAGETIVDVTETGHLVAGQRAFAQAGLTPNDIASFHPYDDFIIAIMLQLEMLGFCKHGQGCDFIREHRLRPHRRPAAQHRRRADFGRTMRPRRRRHQPHRGGAAVVRRRRQAAGAATRATRS